MANPQFNHSSEIDLLLGADVFSKIIYKEQIKVKEFPTIQNTALGWIFFGKIPKLPFVKSKSKLRAFNAAMIDVSCVQKQLSKFWELESLNELLAMNEESLAETHFVDNVTRTPESRVVVRLA